MSISIEQQLDVDYKRLEKFRNDVECEKRKVDAEIRLWRTAGIILILIGLSFFAVPFALPEYGKFAYNEYGDFVGGVVASIWSLAGLMFIYVAFLGQKQQLLLQQLELRHTQIETVATRHEIAGQKEEMKAQNATLALQRFDNSFFNMLANLNAVQNSLRTQIQVSSRISINQHTYATGIKSFEKIYEFTSCSYEEANSKYFYSEFQKDFEAYFTTITLILLFIDRATLAENQPENEELKKHYFDLVIMPMTFLQKITTIYHIALSRDDHPYHLILKDLEKKYHFFKDLYKQDRITKTYEHHILFYAGIQPEKDYNDPDLYP